MQKFNNPTQQQNTNVQCTKIWHQTASTVRDTDKPELPPGIIGGRGICCDQRDEALICCGGA